MASYFLSGLAGLWYEKLFPGPTIADVNISPLLGLPLSYIFFLFLLFTAFGGNKKYWWLGILLIPAAVFELYFDLEHIYFPILLGLLGWVLGWLLTKFKRENH